MFPAPSTRHRHPAALLAVAAACALAVGVACASGRSSGAGAAAPRPSAREAAEAKLPAVCRPLPERTLTYPDVEPVFIQHCHRCHTRSYGLNEKAQAIYESTEYPFTTSIPDTLLPGMVDQWWTRRGIDEAERCLVLHWIYQGARDANGDVPPWTAP